MDWGKVKKYLYTPWAILITFLALLILAGLFWFWAREKTYVSRQTCQNQEACECGEAWLDRDKAKVPAEYECVRPLPQACIFEPGPERKAIDSIRFTQIRDDEEASRDLDLCLAKLSISGRPETELEPGYIQELVDHLNRMDFLHTKERLFKQPGYSGPEQYITVTYRSEQGADTLDTFSRTAGCGDVCSPDLIRLMEILND